jgi:hypothetical protein
VQEQHGGEQHRYEGAPRERLGPGHGDELPAFPDDLQGSASTSSSRITRTRTRTRTAPDVEEAEDEEEARDAQVVESLSAPVQGFAEDSHKPPQMYATGTFHARRCACFPCSSYTDVSMHR